MVRTMDTGGRLLADDTYKETVRIWRVNGEYVVKKFNCYLPFYWRLHCRHAFDNYKNLRHAMPSIEYIWMTDRWECRVFAFILSISEVNAFLILRYFVYCG